MLCAYAHRLVSLEDAEEMEISIKGVEYHISKALKVLRVTLKDYLHYYLGNPEEIRKRTKAVAEQGMIRR